MSTLFGWCMDGLHHRCRIQSGGLTCGCRCHHESPSLSAESDKLATTKATPRGASTPYARGLANADKER